MHPLFAKLNYKGQPEIVVINAPDTFSSIADEMRPPAAVVTNPAQVRATAFAIAFVKMQEEVDALGTLLAEALEGDGVLWLAYPKGSSKKYTCNFNRDTGWAVLGKLGFEPVRLVAVDEDWSALRFRRVEYIKKMTRQVNGALTEAGKVKTRQSPAAADH